MKIKYIQGKAKSLKKLPRDEFVFLILATDFANELAFLIKALLASAPSKPPHREWESGLHTSQVVFYAELAAGKLYEAWRTVEKKYNGSGIAKKYHGIISEEGKQKYEELKKYFHNPANHVKAVRHGHAFHSSAEEIEPTIDAIDDDLDLRILFGPSYTNTFFEFASAITHKAMLKKNLASGDNPSQAFVYKTVIPLSMSYIGFIHAFGVALFQQLEHTLGELGEIDSMKMEKLCLPFFIRQ